MVGVVSSLDDIRYSPANIPIRNLTIHFEDSSKKYFFKFVEFEINAVVIGDLVKEDFKINETYQLTPQIQVPIVIKYPNLLGILNNLQRKVINKNAITMLIITSKMAVEP